MRFSLSRALAGAFAVGGLTLAGLGTAAGAAATAKGTVQSAIVATESATAVKFAGSITEKGTTISLNVSASASGTGQGTIGIGKGIATVRSVGGIVYFKANTAFWTQEGGAKTAQEFSGKWVSTAATSSSGTSLSAFLNSTSFMKQVFGSKLTNSVFAFAGAGRVGGKRTTIISGHDHKNKSGGKLYIARSGKPYILRILINGKSGTGQITFSNYNQPVTPAVPPGAIDLDTLSQSGG
ncbi:MAG: hypothetical protein ACRDYB_14980 [Acidimicrobiales bacterium]